MADVKSRVSEDRILDRRSRETTNLFTRLPAASSASRSQAQRCLQYGGGLSIVEWRTLWDLAEAGPMTIRDLASIQRTDHSLLSRALPEMRKKAYVEMHRDSRDGRQTIVEITAKGRTAYETAAPVMRRRREALRAVFTEAEILTFVGLLDRFDSFLQTPAEDLLDKDHKE